MTTETQEQMDDKLASIFFMCANILEEIKEKLNKPYLRIPDLPLEMAVLLRSIIHKYRSNPVIMAFIEASALKLVKEWGNHFLIEIHDIDSLDAFLDFENEFMAFFKMKERKDKINYFMKTI